MDILQLITSETGNIYKRKASTLGGEYSGSCFHCGGDDRFSIHPAQDHYVCRVCKKAGDSIQFLIDFKGMTYMAACVELNIKPNYNSKPLSTQQQTNTWEPRTPTIPSLTWMQQAEQTLFESYKYLLSSQGKKHRNWLNNRGISNSTIKKARLGWNFQSKTFSRESWGLLPEINENGKDKQIWLPEGLIIPYFVNGKPVRLRIRQENPRTRDRFILISGSYMGYFNYNSHAGVVADTEKPVIVVESEIDGWLLHDIADGNLNVMAIGNAQARPDVESNKLLKQSKILLCLDNDNAGKIEENWWLKQYPQTKIWTVPSEKDPADAFIAGVDLVTWIDTGIKNIDDKNVKPDSLKQKSFKQNVLRTAPAATGRDVPVDMVKSPPSGTGKICVHGHYCQSMKDNICLVAKKNAFDLNRCPKDQWYKYNTSENIIEIIYGCSFKFKRV